VAVHLRRGGGLWSGLVEAGFVGVDDGLDAVADLEFHEDAFDVFGGGLVGHMVDDATGDGTCQQCVAGGDDVDGGDEVFGRLRLSRKPEAPARGVTART
jgi:hypothetical protein